MDTLRIQSRVALKMHLHLNFTTTVPSRSLTNKESVRKRLKGYRQSLSRLEVRRLSAAIVKHLEEFLNDRSNLHILGYLPAHNSNEVDVTDFLSTAGARSCSLALPVVTHYSARANVGAERQAGISRIELRQYSAETPLTRSIWGIDEPVSASVVQPGSIDLAIIPALGADRRGYRLGNGFAYYDELIEQLDCPLVCPVYAQFLTDLLPHDQYDRPVHYLVTENEIIEADTAL